MRVENYEMETLKGRNGGMKSNAKGRELESLYETYLSVGKQGQHNQLPAQIEDEESQEFFSVHH